MIKKLLQRMNRSAYFIHPYPTALLACASPWGGSGYADGDACLPPDLGGVHLPLALLGCSGLGVGRLATNERLAKICFGKRRDLH